MNEGLNWWRDSPGAALRLIVRKFGLLVHNQEIPDNQDPELVRLVAAPVLSWGVIGLGILSPFAGVGIPSAYRSSFGRWVVVTTAVGLGSTALFFVVGRYRIPWIPGLAMLAGVGLVELTRLAKCRRIRSLLWRVGLVLLPMSALAWRPMADPAPERWGHSLISLAVAEMNEFQLEATIDALDDTRTLGGGPALRVEQLLSNGQVHARMAKMIDTRMKTHFPGRRDYLSLARALRQIPEGRAESRRILDILAIERPDDAAVLRESAAWHLGRSEDLHSRNLAIEHLTQAAHRPQPDASAVVLIALAQKDPAYLELLKTKASDPKFARVRLAKAVLAGFYRPAK